MIQFVQQPFFIFAAAAFGIALASLVLVINLRKRWMRMFGKNAPPAGKLLEDILRRVSKSEARLGDVDRRLGALEKIAKMSVQKVGFLRFNPFRDTGGDQSFSLVLLDRDDNGVIISSLYTREGTRVYAKEIKQGQSKQSLSSEEEHVFEEATKQNPKP